MSDHLFWLSDAQFARLQPLLPNKSRGVSSACSAGSHHQRQRRKQQAAAGKHPAATINMPVKPPAGGGT